MALPAPPEAAQIDAVRGDGQTALPGQALDTPLVVRLLDQEGHGVPGESVDWFVSTGGGSVTPGVDITDQDGFASAQWTLGPSAGTHVLDAVVTGVGSVTFSATAEQTDTDPGSGPAAPSAVLSTVVAVPPLISAETGASAEIIVTVRDGAGARIPDATVTLSASGSGNTIAQPAGPTNMDGEAKGSLRSTSPGLKEVTATVNGAIQISQTARITVAGPVHHLEFLVQPHNVREDERFSVRVGLVDVEGNVVPLSGIEIYVDLFREGKRHPDNTRALGDRFEDTENGIAIFDLRVHNGQSGEPAGRSEGGYRLRALTDELPELGPNGPEPFLFSHPFDVD